MNNLNLGQVLVLEAKIVLILQKEGVIDAQGNFVDDLQAELRAFAAIESELKSVGLVVPERVDKIVQMLPLILALVK